MNAELNESAPEYPTAGQRWVQARYLRNQSRSEAAAHRSHMEYLLTDANVDAENPDPDNVRHAGGEQAAVELWERVAVMAQEEMEKWREEAKNFQIEWGDD